MSNFIQRVIGWAAMVLVVLSVFPVGGNVPVVWLFLIATAPVLFAFQILVDFLDPAGKPYRGAVMPAAVLFVGVLVWGFLQLSNALPQSWSAASWEFVDATGTVAVDPAAGRFVLARLIAYAMLFWVIARAAANEQRASQFVRVIALSCVVVAALGLVLSQQGYNPISGNTTRVVTGPFVNPNHFATYCCFGLIASLAALHLMIERRGKGFWRLRIMLEAFFAGMWVYILAVLVLVTAIILSGSRGGLIAAAVGVVVFITMADRSSAKNRVATSAIVLGGLAAFGLATGLGAVLPEFLVGDYEGSRERIYTQTIEAISARPFLGYGLGGYEDAFKAFVSPELASAGVVDFAHNSYLENAFELGIPAAILFYIAIGLVALRIRRGTNERRRRVALPAFGFAVACLAAVHALIDFSLQIPAVTLLFAAILGLGWAQSFPLAAREDLD